MCGSVLFDEKVTLGKRSDSFWWLDVTVTSLRWKKKRTPIITITITLSSLTNNHVAENTGNHNAPFARPPVAPFAPSGPMAVW